MLHAVLIVLFKVFSYTETSAFQHDTHLAVLTCDKTPNRLHQLVMSHTSDFSSFLLMFINVCISQFELTSGTSNERLCIQVA